MKNIHILFYTAALLFAIAALLSFVNGGLLQGGVSILIAVGLYLAGSAQRAKQE